MTTERMNDIKTSAGVYALGFGNNFKSYSGLKREMFSMAEWYGYESADEKKLFITECIKNCENKIKAIYNKER